MKTEFMTQVDGATTSSEDRILIMAATNIPWELDEAVLRCVIVNASSFILLSSYFNFFLFLFIIFFLNLSELNLVFCVLLLPFTHSLSLFLSFFLSLSLSLLLSFFLSFFSLTHKLFISLDCLHTARLSTTPTV